MSKKKVPIALDAIVDVVLSYRPPEKMEKLRKAKRPKKRKRKKRKRKKN